MSHSVPKEHATLKSELNLLTQRSSAVISNWEWRKCFQQSISTLLRYFFLFPIAVWGLFFVARIFGFSFIEIGFVPLLIGTIVLSCLWLVATVVSKGLSFTVSRSEALAFYDQQLESKDRFVSADEFLKSSDRNGFMEAAINDAAEFTDEAKRHRLQPIPAPFKWHWTKIAGPVLGVLSMVLLGWLSPSPLRSITPETPTQPVVLKTKSAERDSENKDTEEKKQILAPSKLKQPPQEQPGNAKPAVSKKTEAQEKTPSKERNESFQKIGGNQSSQTQTSADSNGTGSNPQPQDGESKDEKKKDQNPKQKRKPSGKKKPSKRQKSKKQKPAGVMAGKGTGKSSSSENEDLPSFPKAAKATSNPEDDSEDGDADDEDEQQKSETGNKPTLNNKKPAPSREAGGISPPPGDQQSKSKKPPQRGGRSGVKKSRGVPSAILGVPTPDRLTGTPNASRFKIKQEESSPKEEVTSQIQAESRLSRQGLIGRLPHPSIPLWQQKIVETYFRQKKNNQPKQSK